MAPAGNSDRDRAVVDPARVQCRHRGARIDIRRMRMEFSVGTRLESASLHVVPSTMPVQAVERAMRHFAAECMLQLTAI